MHAGYTVPGVVTGKPISLGGSEGRNEATARGTVFCIVEAARHLGIELPKSTVAIQGFGNAGSIAATLIADEGATVVAVSDSTGGIHNPDGLDIKRVIALEEGARHGPGLPGRAGHRRTPQILEVDVRHPHPGRPREPDHGAERRQRQGPPDRRGGQRPDDARGRQGDRSRAGKFMIPDILCNAGGVTVSYFEWVQDLNRDHWSESVVNAKLKEIMVKAFSETLAIARRDQIDMRTAAYLLAVQRVADATALRGLYP